MTVGAEQRSWRRAFKAAHISLALALASIAGLAFIALASVAEDQHTFYGDLVIAHAIQTFYSPVLTEVMHAATAVGGDAGVLALTAIVAGLMFMRGLRLDAAFALLTLVLRLPNIIIKILIHRPRPTVEELRIIDSLSDPGFPSGHSGGAMIFFGFLAYLAWLRIVRPWVRWGAIAICISAILLIGLSRIYLGAHWPSDVFGGYAYGGVILGLLIETHRRLEQRSLVASQKIS